MVGKADGGPMTKIAFRRMWDKVVQRLEFSVHPHMLRHTYATSLYHAEIDLRTAQYLLGHSSIQMTAEIYTHLGSKDGMKAAGKIESFFTDGKTG